ncbi:hypothetical protein [Belliella baltica]|nr:hypothetical protein [Belliella baltica]
MKKFVHIALVTLLFFQGISANFDVCEQILKISSFFTHYEEHKVYGDSFYEYVIEDYVDKEANNSKHHNNTDNKDAPFHSHHAACHPIVFIANTDATLLKQSKLAEAKQFNLHSFSFNSRYLESLFQPPQV